MQLRKAESLVVAEKVIKEVRKLWPKAWEGQIDAWSNCREQGFSIWLFGANSTSVRANIARVRNGESILVVVGPANQFGGQTNQPNDEVWRSSMSFAPDQFARAARCIISQMRKCFAPVSKKSRKRKS